MGFGPHHSRSHAQRTRSAPRVFPPGFGAFHSLTRGLIASRGSQVSIPEPDVMDDESRSRQLSRLKGLFGPTLIDGAGITRPVATLMQVSHGLQLQSLWIIPTAAVS